VKAAKKPKLGRPPVPKKMAKGSLLSVRFSEGERKLLEQAAQRARTSLSVWARERLLAASDDVETPK